MGEDDLEWSVDRFQVKGSPDQAKTIQEIAFAAYTNHPPGMEAGLEATDYYDPPNLTFPFGSYIAVVDIDKGTGEVKVRRFVAVDDCGNIINPMIVEGQIHGGLTMGLAPALYEEIVYDENGQNLTGTFADYLVPTAVESPSGSWAHDHPLAAPPAGGQGGGRVAHRGRPAGHRQRGGRRPLAPGRAPHRHPDHPTEGVEGAARRGGDGMTRSEGEGLSGPSPRSMSDDFYARAHDLSSAGRPFATATVVRVERPTSGKPGDKAIITAEGELFGWVGGSCAQPSVLAQARAALADGRPRLVRLSSAPDEGRREGMTDLAMTCFSGGTMEIYVEPHLARPHLLVVGDQPLARALAALGRVMGYRVTGVEWEPGRVVEGADEVVTGIGAIASAAGPGTFVVVATHGDHDEVAVEAALASPAPYVALVASRRRAAAVVDYLLHQEVSEAALDERFHSPAGLDLGARRPDEIALSILAEIVQVRSARGGLTGERTDVEEVEVGPTHGSEEAIDPVCGMSVTVGGARHTWEHEGTTYYFCCGGCRAAFSKDPGAFLGARADAG